MTHTSTIQFNYHGTLLDHLKIRVLKRNLSLSHQREYPSPSWIAERRCDLMNAISLLPLQRSWVDTQPRLWMSWREGRCTRKEHNKSMQHWEKAIEWMVIEYWEMQKHTWGFRKAKKRLVWWSAWATGHQRHIMAYNRDEESRSWLLPLKERSSMPVPEAAQIQGHW